MSFVVDLSAWDTSRLDGQRVQPISYVEIRSLEEFPTRKPNHRRY